METLVILIIIIAAVGYFVMCVRASIANLKRVEETTQTVEKLEQSEDKDISYRSSLLRERIRREPMTKPGNRLQTHMLTDAFIDIEGEVIALWKTEQRFKKPPE